MGKKVVVIIIASYEKDGSSGRDDEDHKKTYAEGYCTNKPAVFARRCSRCTLIRQSGFIVSSHREDVGIENETAEKV